MPDSVPPDAALGYDPDIRRWISSAGGGKAAASAVAAAVAAVGSLEQHGAHLAASTDTAIAAEVARRVGRANGYLLLPPVPYGVSFEHAPMFNASLRRGTLAAVLGDLADSLGAGGIGALFVVNGHHGNLGALESLCGRGRGPGRGRRGRPEGRGARVLALSYWHFMDGPFDHAGIAETSLMLAVSGGRGARMGRAARGYVERPGMAAAERADVARRAALSFPSVAPSGVWGDPRGASAARGRRLLAGIARRAAKRCRSSLSGGSRALDGPHEILYSGHAALGRVR